MRRWSSETLLLVHVAILAATACPADGQSCPVSLVNGTFDHPIGNGELANGWRFDGRCPAGGWDVNIGHPGGGVWLNECGQPDSDPCALTTVTELCPLGAYLLQMEYRSSGAYASDAAPFGIDIDGNTVFTANTLPSDVWRSVSILFRPTASSTVLRICAERNDTDSDFFLDNVQVIPTAVITQHPTSVIAAAGVPVTFVVVIEPPPGCVIPTQYRWQRRAPADQGGSWTELVESGRFMNTRSPALVINNPGPAFATGYRCVITPGCGPELITDEVNFEITCPSDFNADGSVDGDDVIAFFENWDSGC